MKRICVVAFIYICSMAVPVQAIDLGDHWQKGELVLQNGQILKGELQLNTDLNTVLLKQGDLIKAFSPYTVDLFRFIEAHKLRSFYTLPYKPDGGVEKLMFFELIFDDNFAIFNREVRVQKEYASFVGLPHKVNSHDENSVKIFEYYIFLPEEGLRKFDTNLAEVSNLLASSKEEKRTISSYVFDHDLDLRRRSDMIKVFNKFINQKEERSA